MTEGPWTIVLLSLWKQTWRLMKLRPLAEVTRRMCTCSLSPDPRSHWPSGGAGDVRAAPPPCAPLALIIPRCRTEESGPAGNFSPQALSAPAQ